jgi:hypothetical protein
MQFIKLVTETALNTPSIPGSELSLGEFRNWVLEAENVPSIPLKEAKMGKQKSPTSIAR